MIRDKTVTIALQSANNEGCFWLAISAKLDRVSLGHEVSIAVSRLGEKSNHAHLDSCLALSKDFHDRS